MIELKNCPICGAHPKLVIKGAQGLPVNKSVENNYYIQYVCPDCGRLITSIVFILTKHDKEFHYNFIGKEWNRRVEKMQNYLNENPYRNKEKLPEGVCPFCGGKLIWTSGEIVCAQCGSVMRRYVFDYTAPFYWKEANQMAQYYFDKYVKNSLTKQEK